MDEDLFGAFEGNQVVEHVEAAVSAEATAKRRSSDAAGQPQAGGKRSRVEKEKKEDAVQEEISTWGRGCGAVWVL